MAEKKIYLHHERNTTAGALTDIQNRELVYTSEIDYLIFKTAGGTARYLLTMSTNAMSESGGDITLTSGTGVNEFSIDGTLAGNSDDAVPTEKAVKTYVDAQVGGENYWDRTGTVLSTQTAGDDLDIGGTVGIGDAGHEGSGLTINQLALDDVILSLKSSDVAHATTSLLETDTYFGIKKAAGATGGTHLISLTDGGDGFQITANKEGEESGVPVTIDTILTDGAGGIADITTGQLFIIENNSSTYFKLSFDGSISTGNASDAIASIDRNFYSSTNSGKYEWNATSDHFIFSDDILMNTNEKIKLGAGAIGEIYSDNTDTYIISTNDNYLSGANVFLQGGGVTQATINSSDGLKVDTKALLATDKKLLVRDSAIGIYSQADTFLDIFADGGVRIGNSSAGAPAHYTKFDTNGSPIFVGTAGLAFANIAVGASAATVTVDSDTGYTLLTQWTADGQSNNCTADYANNKITLINSGRYYISFCGICELDAGSAVDLTLLGYVNGGSVSWLRGTEYMSSTEKHTFSFSTFANIGGAYDIDIRATINSATARALTVSYASLNVVQVGGAV